MQLQIMITNVNVQVLWQKEPEMVVVTDLKNMSRQQPFAGYDGIKEQFDAYCNSFNENIGYQSTIEYFKPNIQQTVINAPGN